jgi:hypothetical protein
MPTPEDLIFDRFDIEPQDDFTINQLIILAQLVDGHSSTQDALSRNLGQNLSTMRSTLYKQSPTAESASKLGVKGTAENIAGKKLPNKLAVVLEMIRKERIAVYFHSSEQQDTTLVGEGFVQFEVAPPAGLFTQVELDIITQYLEGIPSRRDVAESLGKDEDTLRVQINGLFRKVEKRLGLGKTFSNMLDFVLFLFKRNYVRVHYRNYSARD